MPDDVRYYYFRDAQHRPMVTLCRVVVGLVCSYGWAICSERDNPEKRIGRALAKDRALAALTPQGGGMLLGIRNGASVWRWGRAVTRGEAWKLAVTCHTAHGGRRYTLSQFLGRSPSQSLTLQPTALLANGWHPTCLPPSMQPVVARRSSPLPPPFPFTLGQAEEPHDAAD